MKTNYDDMFCFEVAYVIAWYAGKAHVRLIKVQDSGSSVSAIPVGIGFGPAINLLFFLV